MQTEIFIEGLGEKHFCFQKLKPKPIKSEPSNDSQYVKEYILNTFGVDVLNFIQRYSSFEDVSHLLVATAMRFNILKQGQKFQQITNLRRINDIRYVNKFFEEVNKKLNQNGIFIGLLETKKLRKQRILCKYPKGINYFAYTIDFIIKRIFPKLPITKKLYFFLTRGNNRVLTKVEILGRLISCGFEIIEERNINGYLYFVTRKVKEPTFDMEPTYGPLIKLKRIGQHGNIIKVYKLRTMHPFSEYLQEYLYYKNKLQEGGKIKNDFRITKVGKILRKLWLDELPMLLNLFKGEIKLVGVRPLSYHYYNLYTEELKQKRIQFKPGLLPPFYADMPENLEEIMKSEMKYLKEFEKQPLKTDIKYFFLIFYNIIKKNGRK